MLHQLLVKLSKCLRAINPFHEEPIYDILGCILNAVNIYQYLQQVAGVERYFLHCIKRLSIPLEKIKRPEVFYQRGLLMFSEGLKETSGKKWVKRIT